MEFIFDKQKTPEIYKRNNKSYYLGPIRKKLIQITPEETVRQKMIQFILNYMKIPEKLISVEKNYRIMALTLKCELILLSMVTTKKVINIHCA